MGSMIFFTAIVSPSVFASLNSNYSSKFLRKIFPRMFLFGFILSALALCLTLLLTNIFSSLLLLFVALSFIANRNYLTPKINQLRDEELEGKSHSGKKFKLFHQASVVLFIVNFLVLSLILILNYF